MNPLLADVPSLPLQEHVDPVVPEPGSRESQLSDPHPQGQLWIGDALLVVRAPLELEKPARPLRAQRVQLAELPDELALARRL